MSLHRDDLLRRDLLKASLQGAWAAAAGLPLAAGTGLLTGLLPSRSEAGATGNSYILELVPRHQIDSVLLWTDVMLQHVRDAGMPPKVAARAMATGLLAGFLAMNGIGRRYRDNFNLGPGPANADKLAAYHVATGTAMEEGFGQPFNHIIRRFLAKVPDGQAKTEGVDYGRAIGRKVAAWRRKDGSDSSKAPFYHGRYQKKSGVLAWEPTMSHFRPGVGPRIATYHQALMPSWGYVTPFGVADITRYRAVPFPDAPSPEFAADYEKIRLLGGADSRIRTADQAEIAFFWEDGPPGATPPGRFIATAAQLFAGRFDTYEMARNMALVAMSQADAAISAWDSKYFHDILRPETAIRERGNRFGSDRRFQRDPKWNALIITPPFPAYTSGHSTFGAAGARMIWNCIGTNDVKYSLRPIDLAWWPEQLRGVERHFTTVWQSAEENGLSRLYGGVHWTFDHQEGMRAGREIADAIFDNFFLPLV